MNNIARHILVSFAVVLTCSFNQLAAAPVNNKSGLPDLESLAEETAPAVVFVANTVNLEPVRKKGSFGEFISQVFGSKTSVKQIEAQEEPEKAMASGGSGFIISPDGYILSNAHVVEGADAIFIKMKDGRGFPARVIGSDKKTDVALMKIEADCDLPYLKFGNSDSVKAGQWVMAIGSPHFLEDTVTAGIISKKKRDIGMYLSYIQSDVVTNQGNSGGPLINMDGEAIGINTLLYDVNGGNTYIGMSLAVPINDAIRVAAQLKKHCRVLRGYIGVAMIEVDQDKARSLHLPPYRGLLVVDIRKGFPAEKAGLKKDDIILDYNNHPVGFRMQLTKLVGETAPGTTSRLRVMRDGKIIDLPIVISTMPESDEFKIDASW